MLFVVSLGRTSWSIKQEMIQNIKSDNKITVKTKTNKPKTVCKEMATCLTIGNRNYLKRENVIAWGWGEAWFSASTLLYPVVNYLSKYNYLQNKTLRAICFFLTNKSHLKGLFGGGERRVYFVLVLFLLLIFEEESL